MRNPSSAHIGQEEERACEIEGREMDSGAQRELRLCEVMCRHVHENRTVLVVYRKVDIPRGNAGALFVLKSLN